MNEKALEARRRYQREWRKKNAEKVKEYGRTYAQKNKEAQRKREEAFFNRLAEENNNGQ